MPLFHMYSIFRQSYPLRNSLYLNFTHINFLFLSLHLPRTHFIQFFFPFTPLSSFSSDPLLLHLYIRPRTTILPLLWLPFPNLLSLPIRKQPLHSNTSWSSTLLNSSTLIHSTHLNHPFFSPYLKSFISYLPLFHPYPPLLTRSNSYAFYLPVSTFPHPLITRSSSPSPVLTLTYLRLPVESYLSHNSTFAACSSFPFSSSFRIFCIFRQVLQCV